MKRPYKIQRFGHSYVVVIPKAILDKLQWKGGTEVHVESVDGRVVVTDCATRTKDLLEIRLRESIAKLSKSA